MDYECVMCGHNDCNKIVDVKMVDIDYSLIKDQINTKDRSFMMCPSCGFISIFPRYSEEVLKSYYKNVPTSQFDDNVLKRYTNIFYEATINYLDGIIGLKGKRIFDVGASQGLLLNMVKGKFGCEVAGLEPSQECVKFAQDNFNIELIDCMLNDLDFEKEEHKQLKEGFDVVLCLHVLDLVSNPKIFLRSLISLTKPGGYIYVDVPSWFVKRYPNPRYGNTLCAIHHNHFSPFSIIKFLEMEHCTPLATYTELSSSNYPTQRFLFRKMDYTEGIKDEFKKYFESRHIVNYENALMKVKNCLENFEKVIFYGGGEDLFCLIESNKEFFEKNIDKFQCVDHNKQKSGKKLFLLEIEPVERLLTAKNSIVFSTSTSQMVQRHIKSDFDKLNTDLKFDNLFSDDFD